MATTRKTDLIFAADRSMLEAYYGMDINNSTMELLVACHEKLQSDTASVLHITTNLRAIQQSGSLLTSAGGLGGCVYGMPIFKDNTLHNLGNYIIHDELPMFLKNQRRTATLAGLIITPHDLRLGCIDYLSFGAHYFGTYNLSARLQDNITSKDLEDVYSEQRGIVSALSAHINASTSLNNKAESIAEAVERSYLLRMLYFEAILEYVLLFQNDQPAQNAAIQHELYNKNAKDLIFALNPALATRFSLANFHSSPMQINHYLVSAARHNRIITDYRPEHFYDYLCRRLQFYIHKYLLDDEANFKGHLLFRHFDEREYFEQSLAEELWTEAEQENYNLLTYRMPKGEVGMLPRFATKIFIGHPQGTGWQQGQEAHIQLIKVLATKHTAMRDPYSKK